MRSSDQIDAKNKNESASFFEKSHDQQIKESKHDEIVLWLYRTLKDVDFLRGFFKIDDIFEVMTPNVKIEHPIIGIKGRVIGFVDVALFFSIKRPKTVNEKNMAISQIDKESHFYIKEFMRLEGIENKKPNEEQEFKYYAEKVVNYNNRINKELGDNSCCIEEHISMFFEVKTRVNIGETIRQINYYKSNSVGRHQEAVWYICAPPFNEKNILVEQNIGFMEYKP